MSFFLLVSASPDPPSRLLVFPVIIACLSGMKTHMWPCGTLRVRLLRTFALPYDRHTSRHRMAKASGAAGGEASRSTVMLPSFCWERGGDHTVLTDGHPPDAAELPAGSPVNNDDK